MSDQMPPSSPPRTHGLPTATWIGLLWSVGVPLFWVAGVEQLSWIVGTSVILALSLVFGRVRLPLATRPVVYAWSVFLFAILLSGVQIQEGYRIISFARDLSVYASCLILFLVCASVSRDPRSGQRILWHLAVFVVIGNLAALSHLVFGPWSMSSLVSGLVPSGIAETTTGSRIIEKSTAGRMSFFGLIDVRARGFGFSSIQYAASLVLVFPAFLWLARNRLGSAGLIHVALITSLMGLFFSQSRTAMAVLLILPVIYVVTRILLEAERLVSTRVLAAAAVLLGVVGLVAYQFSSSVITLFERVFIDVREGSFLARLQVYRLTLEGILERPFTGWGTQRDVEGLLFPVGSHNWLLGVLYKYGILGFTAWVAWLLYLLRAILRSPRETGETPAAVSFRTHAAAGVLAYLLITLTLEPIVDAIAIHMFSAMAGLAAGQADWRLELMGRESTAFSESVDADSARFPDVTSP